MGEEVHYFYKSNPTNTMRLFFLAILIASFWSAPAQKRNFDNMVRAQEKWFNGNILLNDRETFIDGLLQFNQITGALTFKSTGNPEILLPSNVSKVSFFDEDNHVERTFISLDYSFKSELKENKIGKHLPLEDLAQDLTIKTTPLFFEVLKETSEFVLLASQMPTKSVERNVLPGGLSNSKQVGRGSISKTEFTFDRNLYFLDSLGNLYPHAEITRKVYEKESVIIKSELVQKDLVHKLMEEQYKQIDEFIDKNKFRLTNEEHLLKIIDFYESLKLKH